MHHNWFLTFESRVPDQLRALLPKGRIAVFATIAGLLVAENPTHVPGVRKLVEKRFEGIWRQRQGNYRIFFELHPGEIEHQGFPYKGRLHLIAIRHRSQAY